MLIVDIMETEIVKKREGDTNMNFILFFVIPVGLFMGGLGMWAMMESQMTLLPFLGFFFGGILVFALLGGYIYSLWRLGKPNRDRAASYEKTQQILSYRVGSGEYDYIYVNLQNCRASCHRPDGSTSPFSFSEYGYHNVDCSSVLSILRNLEYRLDGYLSVQYKDYAVYDPSVTVTHGTMPGGGDGYYVNVGSYDTGSMPTCAYLYLGEMARQKRREAKKKNSIFR